MNYKKLTDCRVLLAPLHYRIGPNVGGSELSWAFEIANQIRKHALHVDGVVGDARSMPTLEGLAISEVSPLANVNYFGDDVMRKLLFVMKYTIRAGRLMKNEKYDIFHHVLPFGKGTFNPLVIGRNSSLGIPKSTRVIVGPVQNPHDVYFADEEQFNRFSGKIEKSRVGYPLWRKPMDAVASELSRLTLRRADAVVALSHHGAKFVRELAGDIDVRVISAGIDHERFPIAVREAKKTFVLVSASYLLKRKGFDLVFRSIAEIVASGCDVKYLLAGTGPELLNLQEQAGRLGISRNVSFLGVLDANELRSVYARSDLFITMSWSESFGVAVLEAMSTGLPIVSASNLGATEIVKDNETGFLVPLGDHTALTEAILRYWRNSELRTKHGIEGSKRVRNVFDWGRIGRMYAELYQEVMARPSGLRVR